MTHAHPLPEERPDICPACTGPRSECCAVLDALREARRKRERRYYHRHPEASRARRLKSYHGRKTKPPGVSGPLDPPTTA